MYTCMWSDFLNSELDFGLSLAKRGELLDYLRKVRHCSSRNVGYNPAERRLNVDIYIICCEVCASGKFLADDIVFI